MHYIYQNCKNSCDFLQEQFGVEFYLICLQTFLHFPTVSTDWFSNCVHWLIFQLRPLIDFPTVLTDFPTVSIDWFSSCVHCVHWFSNWVHWLIFQRCPLIFQLCPLIFQLCPLIDFSDKFEDGWTLWWSSIWQAIKLPPLAPTHNLRRLRLYRIWLNRLYRINCISVTGRLVDLVSWRKKSDRFQMKSENVSFMKLNVQSCARKVFKKWSQPKVVILLQS